MENQGEHEPTPTPPDARERLTARERAVLEASARGLVVAEVADTLALTPGTVRAALASAVAKLGARTKLEAVVVALRRGLIDVPTD